ncbi:hypothetical protein Vafri_11316, partial [Volvox africanus]
MQATHVHRRRKLRTAHVVGNQLPELVHPNRLHHPHEACLLAVPAGPVVAEHPQQRLREGQQLGLSDGAAQGDRHDVALDREEAAHHYIEHHLRSRKGEQGKSEHGEKR